MGLPVLRAADRWTRPPATRRPHHRRTDPTAWEAWKGYFQLSRFKFVDGATPTLDLAPSRRSSRCRSTAGPAATWPVTSTFDSNNNLWLVTGDDTPAGGGGSGGFSPHNDWSAPPGSTRPPSSTPGAARPTPTTCAARSCASRCRRTARTPSRPATCSRPSTAKTRPEIYAMGFRNPFRITVDKHGVAYVTDYSPTPRRPGGPGAGGHRPDGWSSTSRRTTAGRCATRRTCRTSR